MPAIHWTERAYDIGYDTAESYMAREDADHDLDAVDDHVFPDAFAEALDAFPLVEAADLSPIVHEGISDAWRAADLTDYH